MNDLLLDWIKYFGHLNSLYARCYSTRVWTDLGLGLGLGP